MNLLLMIISSVIFALVLGILSDYYKSKIIHTISVIISILLVLSFYYFLSTHFFHPKEFLPKKTIDTYTPVGNYYNLVLIALKKGDFHISDSSKHNILKDSNIYKNYPYYAMKDLDSLRLLDTSYYKDKIYFYFGITPVLLFYAPFNFITGLFLSDKFIVFILSIFIFILSLLITRTCIQKFTSKPLPVYMDILTVFLIGFCNYLPFLLIRPFSYEVAITSATFLLFLCLYLFLIYCYTNRNSYVLIFFFALLISLSVGCRPHYILLIPLFVFVIIPIENFKGTNLKTIIKFILVFIAPCILYGFFLALYNYLRFDSIFEFGRTYQLNGLNQIDWHFKIQDLLTGIKYNLFQTPVINEIFPIFSLTLAQGHSVGDEFITGILYTFPLILILLLFPFIIYILWKRDKMISIFLLLLTFISTLNLFVDTSIAGIVQRYIFEYIYLGVLISIIIFYYLHSHTKSVLIKYMLHILFITIYVFSIYMNISLLFCYENSLFYKTSSNGNYEKIVNFLS